MSSSVETGTRSSGILRKDLLEPSISIVIATTWAVLLALLLLEIVEVNRVLRTWIQGRGFWAYLLAFAVVLTILSTLGSLLLTKLGELSLSSILFVGAISGFLASFVAIPISPLLLGRGIAPALNALRHPLYLMTISTLALGWLCGILSGFLAYAILRKRYTMIYTLLLAATLIRFLELGMHLWLGGALIR